MYHKIIFCYCCCFCTTGDTSLFKKRNTLQDLLSSVSDAISTNERIGFIAGHMTYNLAYILQTTTTNINQKLPGFLPLKFIGG